MKNSPYLRPRTFHSAEPLSEESPAIGLDIAEELPGEAEALMDNTMAATSVLKVALVNFLVAYGKEHRYFADITALDMVMPVSTISDEQIKAEALGVSERHLFTLTLIAERLLDERLEPLMLPKDYGEEEVSGGQGLNPGLETGSFENRAGVGNPRLGFNPHGTRGY